MLTKQKWDFKGKLNKEFIHKILIYDKNLTKIAE